MPEGERMMVGDVEDMGLESLVSMSTGLLGRQIMKQEEGLGVIAITAALNGVDQFVRTTTHFLPGAG